MPLDLSIYQNIRPVEMPDNLGNATKAAQLSQLMRESQAQDKAIADKEALRGLYAQNTGADGKLNQAGFLSAYGKANPENAMQMQGQFSKLNKDEAESQSAHAEAIGKQTAQIMPTLEKLNSMPEEQRASAYPVAIAQLKTMGVDTSRMPDQYDHEHFIQTYNTGRQLKDWVDVQNTRAQTNKANAEAGKAESETIKRDPNTFGQVNDPAKLVPGRVPKEHQSSVFKEIDAAENTKRMSKAIMDSFEQSVLDTSGSGALTSYIKTPRSSQALHQAMQPTFKDLEGTVRQAAMDNTFKNITPVGTDTAEDIETKRRALEDYLQSKASAPTARGYNIDLSKFDSTSAYQRPQKVGAPDPSGSGTAYAAELPKPGAKDGGYVFMGGNPADPKSWKRAK